MTSGTSNQPLNESDDERVRVCPECSEIVAFDVRTCPACQHHDPLLDYPALGAETRRCVACEAQMLHSLLFCPSCGHERDAPARSVAPRSLKADDRDARPYAILALVLTWLGPLVLLTAVLSVFI